MYPSVLHAIFHCPAIEIDGNLLDLRRWFGSFGSTVRTFAVCHTATGDDDLLPTKSSVEATTVKRLGRRQEQADGNGEAVQTKLKYTTSLIPV